MIIERGSGMAIVSKTVYAEGNPNVLICYRTQKCHYCGNPATLLCDYPTEWHKTCDRPICNDCSVHVGYERDYCRCHPPIKDGEGG